MGTTNNELKLQQPVDRISDLPDCVQIRILSLLDTEDAIRTSILSKRWHRMWTHLPDLELYLGPKMLSVDRTLSFHAAPRIFKFHLQLEDLESVDSKMVDMLVDHAATRNVEDLSLDLSGLRWIYVLPEYLYYQRSLRELRTENCNFFPRRRVNWGSLRVLDVTHGRMKGEIEDILSGCPSLESLSLCRFHLSGGVHIVHEKLKRLVLDHTNYDFVGYNKLEFHVRAPQLEELEILGYWFWNSCKFIDTLSLVRVRLDFLFGYYRHGAGWMFQNALKELFERVGHSQELHIVIRCSGDPEKMEIESLCATLSHRKCSVLKVLIDESSDDESSYEFYSDDE